MPTSLAADSRGLGDSIRQARRARVRMIRKRIVAGAVALFVAVWLLIAVVLITGHDPALAKRSGAGSTTASAAGTSTTSPSGTSGSGATSSSGSSNSTVGSSPLTTRQS